MTHIIDTLIAERATNWLRYPRLWHRLERLLRPMMRYDLAREVADAIAPLSGVETLVHMQRLLAMDVRVSGLEHVPRQGLAVVTPNHPAGIADGIAVYEALGRVRKDITFFANRDAIRICPGLADIIVPVEWRDEARSRAKTRETLHGIRHAFESERLVVVFPSGRLARPTPFGLRERPWQTSAFDLAQKYRAPILPMHIRGHNSALYYFFWFCNQELKDMTLFREVVNKRGGQYRITVAEPFRAVGDPAWLAPALRRFVVRDLPRGVSRFRRGDGATSVPDQRDQPRTMSSIRTGNCPDERSAK